MKLIKWQGAIYFLELEKQSESVPGFLVPHLEERSIKI